MHSAINYAVGRWLGKKLALPSQRKAVLGIGICVNLALIFYFKYINFFANNLNQLVGSQFNFSEIILPLAISFFTFQQIAYLVDSYRGETKSYGFISYCLFVCFFPQLITGPIVHHKDVLGQFRKPSIYKFSSLCFSVGCFILFAGLFKKVIFADRIAIYASPVFEAASQGIELSAFEAWILLRSRHLPSQSGHPSSPPKSATAANFGLKVNDYSLDEYKAAYFNEIRSFLNASDRADLWQGEELKAQANRR